jgi:hypothetical protein
VPSSQQPPITVKLRYSPRIGLVTANEATIYWDIDTAAPGELHWGKTNAYGNSISDNSWALSHRLTAKGLTAATKYHFRVVSGTTRSNDNTFTTAALPSMDFRFITMADNRHKSVADELISVTEPFARILALVTSDAYNDVGFVIHAGDIFHGQAPQEESMVLGMYDVFKKATGKLAGSRAFLISPGNHEMSPGQAGFDPLKIFNEQFAQPAVLEGYPGTCFSWDWGNSHFVSVDSCHHDLTLPRNGMYRVSAQEISWLEADLKAAQARKVRHIFVFSHTNLFHTKSASDMEGSGIEFDPSSAAEITRILARYGVDAYICGHAHTSNDVVKDGVLEWLNGDSGCILEPDGGRGYNHWTLWTVTGDTVTAELIDDLGKVKRSRIIKSLQPR